MIDLELLHLILQAIYIVFPCLHSLINCYITYVTNMVIQLLHDDNFHKYNFINLMYHIVGKLGGGENFGNLANNECFVNHQRFAKLKPPKVVITINNILADLSFAKLFAKIFVHPVHQTLLQPTFPAMQYLGKNENLKMNKYDEPFS